jgi:very-short-patch-repair endonuclease
MQLETEDTTTQVDTTKVENKLNFWAKELHDMSGRNRLLFYKDTKTSTATIESPRFIELFELLVERGGELLAPLPDPKEVKSIFDSPQEEAEANTVTERLKKTRKLKENEIRTNHTIPVLNKVLYNLRYTSRTVKEEQGFNILYITLGMLKWKEFQNGDFNYAPLILVPIQIERGSPVSPYKISMAEDDIVVNPVLQTKLSKDFAIQLPEISNDISSSELKEFLATVSLLMQEMQSWEVLERVTIGAFNFLTLLLIKDFENYVDLYKLHPIVQLLSGIDSVSISIPDDLPLANELDDRVDPTTVYQIMDADSSQQEAIEAAKRGLSFILQGPPGTGKSQTIANIIAEFLMAEKKVLFVSQKMAALEVVQNRLNKKGLGEFCLEVHSHKMDKRKVIEDLMRSLSNSSSSRKTNYISTQNEIKQLRGDLNAYVRQLHEPRFELNVSLYQAQGELSKILNAPQISFNFPNLEKLTPSAFNKLLSLIREITSYSKIITTYKNNRWKGFRSSQISIQEREEISARLKETANATDGFCKLANKIVLPLNLPVPETIKNCLNYHHIFEYFTPDVFSASLQTVINNYIQKYQSPTRYFSVQYWKDSSKLKVVYRNKTRPDPKTILPVLNKVVSIKSSASQSYDDTAPNHDQSVREIQELRKLRTKMSDGFDFAEKLFEENDLPDVLKLKADQRPEIAVEWFVDHSLHADELAEWANFNAIRIECVQNGLNDFIAKALEEELPPSLWKDSFLRRFYLLLTERMLSDRPALQKFRGSLQAETLHRFRELDIKAIESASYEIRNRLYENKPQASWIQAGTAETSILRKEFNKKRRIMPLRRLFQEIPNLIQSLKPCLMMSPLTVCQLLNPHLYQFDLVLFDEASQIPPEYAINAFLRAKQVIVAGDRQQLPPTNFFHVIESDDDFEDDDDETASFESILNACDSSGFRNKMLNWHYRSKDESLIAYSNYHFYENRLMTFPNASSTRNQLGLNFVHVKDGVYKRGVGARHNLQEARKIADLVREHLSKTPDLSLGIVAFSVSQRKAIEAEIELLRKNNPDLNALFSYDVDEPIFIKNLENVQGDERDVIILSVGYGKDETGKMTLNFGPINRQGGSRRLNVAVTRARYALTIVSSIEPEDIDLARAESEGASLLRNYLEVARDGIKSVYKDLKIYSDAEFDSPFEESVYNELSRMGVQLKPQVGVSQYRIDLAVVDPEQPGRFLLGIECDGAMYHSALTARDRDRLRQQVLEELGWSIHRIWSRDWIQNREVEIEKVLDAIETSKKKGNENVLSKKKRTGE